MVKIKKYLKNGPFFPKIPPPKRKHDHMIMFFFLGGELWKFWPFFQKILNFEPFSVISQKFRVFLTEICSKTSKSDQKSWRDEVFFVTQHQNSQKWLTVTSNVGHLFPPNTFCGRRNLFLTTTALRDTLKSLLILNGGTILTVFRDPTRFFKRYLFLVFTRFFYCVSQIGM